MAIKGTISLDDLVTRLVDICEGIARDGDVWEVRVGPMEQPLC